MSDLAVMAGLPDVRGAVLGDLAGTFIDAIREPDGETLAAEMAFLATSLREAGDGLGLGTLRTVSIGGGARAAILALRGSTVVSALVDPPRALAAVEKAVESAFTNWE